MIKYIYYKTPQGINFGTCSTTTEFKRVVSRLTKEGWKVEQEVNLSEQLKKIKNEIYP